MIMSNVIKTNEKNMEKKCGLIFMEKKNII
jgi:hypothetical protein